MEYQRETGGRILRVYIDKPGGVGIDDCVNISRQLGDLLDIYLEDAPAYHLEVTSPGSDRPLGKKADFERFKGQTAKIKTSRTINGQKNFTGRLLGVTGQMVYIEKNAQTVSIPYQDILKARLVNHHGENEC